jgi:hypothetical protein
VPFLFFSLFNYVVVGVTGADEVFTGNLKVYDAIAPVLTPTISTLRMVGNPIDLIIPLNLVAPLIG